MTDILLTIRHDAEMLRSYSVPYQEGMSVLDGLKYLSSHQADDLAFRWECGQGVCGVCTMTINGRPALSCAVLAEPGGVYLCEPLAGFPVKKDLVVDLEPRTADLLSVQPHLTEGGHAIQSREEADASRKVRMCVECWACVSVCPVSLAGDANHALSMVKLARFALDPRDGTDRVAAATAAGLDSYSNTCASCRACADICPKGIDVYIDAVRILENG